MGAGQGSMQTFDEVALPCLPEVARFARSLTHDASDADDLVQETYLRAFEAWHSFQLGTDCRRWLFTICRHIFLRTRERAQRVVSVEDPEAETLGAAGRTIARATQDSMISTRGSTSARRSTARSTSCPTPSRQSSD